MKTRYIVVAAIAALFVAAIGSARADSDTDSFTVTATVLASCEVAANDLDFGDYDPVIATHLDVATTLAVTCTNGTPYDVGLGLGAGAGATTTTRYMQGADPLGYGLYRNAGRTLLWGEDEGNNTVSAVGDGTPDTINVYGRVPMQQDVGAGNYTDTVIVTVSW